VPLVVVVGSFKATPSLKPSPGNAWAHSFARLRRTLFCADGGDAYTYMNVGQAMGAAMVGLLKQGDAQK